MIVWRVIGGEIGPDGNDAAHFATKAEAIKAAKEWRKLTGNPAPEPERLSINSREELAEALNEAMGYGVT